MAKTNWQDPGSSEMRSTHISGLQEAVGKIEETIGIESVAENGIALTEVSISELDRYRIYQAAVGKRNWLSSPAPVIKKNGNVISTGVEIDYGGGAIILGSSALSTDVFTADVTYTKKDSVSIKNCINESTGYGVINGLAVTAQSTPNMTVNVPTGIIYMSNSVRFTPVANSALAITVANPTNPRIDIVYINSSGVISYLTGTAAASPTAPSLPAGGFLLAEIAIAANATSITSANITDKRLIKYNNNALSSQLTLIATQMSIGKIKKYGTKFTGSNPVGERLYDSVGMNAPVAVDNQIVQNDFDKVSFYNRPMCNVYFDSNGNPTVMAYRGEPGFNFEGAVFPPYADKAEVYYECTPCGWNGSFDEPVVTGTPCEGIELFSYFPNWNTKMYLPTFWMSAENGKPTSRSGTRPGYYSLNSAMSVAKTWNANAHTETTPAHLYEYILQLVEFATRDVQTIMMGACNLRYNSATDVATIAETAVNRIIVSNATASNYVVGQTIVIGTTQNGTQVATERSITAIDVYDTNNKSIVFDGTLVNIAVGNFVSSRVWKNGATDVVRASSGSLVSNTSGKYPCIWRGKVDPWAQGFSVLCDFLIKRNGAGTTESPYTYKPYFLSNPRKYSNGTITSDYVELQYNLPQTDGYAKTLQQDSRYKYLVLTREVGASSTTYLAAYYYYPRYDICVVFVGGDFLNGRLCSPVSFDCYVTPSRSDINYLARLFVSRV